MKTAFSTLACPDFSWQDIYSMAKDFGFHGIEIRGLGNDIFSVKAAPFTDENVEATAAKLKKINVEIPCLSSGEPVNSLETRQQAIDEITAYAKLANKLGTSFIRVLGDKDPMPKGEIDDNIVIETMKLLVPVAEEYNVTLLLESNGVYADTKRLAKVIDAIGSRKVAALWDMHHPYRFMNESPAETVANLGERIKYTHTKDSVMGADGKVEYKLIGTGDIPVKECLEALDTINYQGYVSLEWVYRWSRNIADAGVVVPHFASFMEPYKIYHRHDLQVDNRGTGYYPWPKETIIDVTFPDVLDRICENFPNQYAFRYTEPDIDYIRTYSEFRDDVDTLARSFLAMGCKKGDHIAIWATNVPQWYLTFWAATKIGCVLVTVNTAYRIHEIEYILRQSDTHTLVMIDKFKDIDYNEIINEICPELKDSKPGELNAERLPFLKNVIVCKGEDKPGCYNWEQAMAKSVEVPYSEVEKIRRTIDKHDVCNMQYTSGTTGFPKGVMLTHYNVVNNGKAIGDCMDLSTNDKMMIQVPMFHCFGMVLAMTASMTHGVTMSPISAFSPRKGLYCINKEKITCFHGVPTMFIAMLGHADFPTTDFSHMRTGIMAGSPCPVKTMEEVIEKMHMPEIVITYGQTEASPATTMSKTTDTIEQRVNTVGPSLFGVETKIVDPETGEELPDGMPGEFCARGYNIMKGYYKMPEATAAAIDEDGWLHSGDLALRRPEDGYYKITGRIKDMIIRGGENLYPKEIEDFLYTHPKVQDVQVIGVPDKDYGEEVDACIILKPGEEATVEEIKEFCLANMAKHKCPRYVDFVDSFPMNAAGKILKYKMREEAVERHNLGDASKIVTA